MMKCVLLLFLLWTSIFANQKVETKKKSENKKVETLSKKEKAYLKEKKRLEAENKQLEEDGFCSCNNH